MSDPLNLPNGAVLIADGAVAIGIEKRLGVGTFGAVYQASIGGQQVALKVAKYNSEELKKECQILQELQNVVGVPKLYLNRNVLKDFSLLAMDKFDRTLDGYMKNLTKSKDRERAAAKIGVQLLSTLRNIHSKSIVHCDLKPDNIMLDTMGKAYLIDFGCAKRMGEKISNAGNEFYQSIRCYNKDHSVGPSDDVESLRYVFLKVIMNSTPWDVAKINVAPALFDNERANIKKRYTAKNLLDWDMAFREYYDASAAEKVDYDKLIGILSKY